MTTEEQTKPEETRTFEETVEIVRKIEEKTKSVDSILRNVLGCWPECECSSNTEIHKELKQQLLQSLLAMKSLEDTDCTHCNFLKHAIIAELREVLGG